MPCGEGKKGRRQQKRKSAQKVCKALFARFKEEGGKEAQSVQQDHCHRCGQFTRMRRIIQEHLKEKDPFERKPFATQWCIQQLLLAARALLHFPWTARNEIQNKWYLSKYTLPSIMFICEMDVMAAAASFMPYFYFTTICPRVLPTPIWGCFAQPAHLLHY